ncbi:hypothetical protein BB558_000418 [Smittium angustum]|uniref:SGNH hydrolase-type esterase domain-containing protein n=1 Tax=Smittium angustum TaxID=133377 RepID=A0A2U1JEB2_SMIAN|nr:hypothetical protein BB558_000418 [Smittium angustum]
MYSTAAFTLIASLSLFPLSTLAQATSKPSLIVFGNSLSDVNNKNYFTNYTYPVPYWHGRYSNGPVWNEYFSFFDSYPLINFAVGGAVSNDSFVNSISGENITLPSVNDQISIFNKTFGNLYPNKTAIQNDIGFIEIGSNDVFYSITGIASGNITFEEFSSGYIYSITNAAQSFIKMGYRKLVISDIPDFRLFPSSDSIPAPLELTIVDYIQRTNDLIYETIKILNSQSSAVDYVRLFSFYDSFQAFSDPQVTAALNITNISDPCHVVNDNETALVFSCSNPDQYLFIDGFHPHTRPHALLGAILSEFVKTQNFSLSTDVVLEIIKKYNISSISSTSNPLFFANSSATGILNINEYNVSTAIQNANSIAQNKNGTPGTETKVGSANSIKNSLILIPTILISLFILV